MSKEEKIKALQQEFAEENTNMRGVMIAAVIGGPTSMLLELPRNTSAILAGFIGLIIYNAYDSYMVRRRFDRLMKLLAEQ